MAGARVRGSVAGSWRRLRVQGRPFATEIALWLLTAGGVVVWLLLAGHVSTEPTVLGRWSTRYAWLLALVAAATLVPGVLSVPAWRARLLRRSARPVTGWRAWAPMAGLALLPALYVVLRGGLLAGEDRVYALLTSLLLAGTTALLLLLLWRSGAAGESVTIRRPLLWLGLLTVAQLLLATRYLEQVPLVSAIDETGHIANALRQFNYPTRFVLLRPDHNARTWVDFSAYWVPAGAWYEVFGAGIRQARVLNLLVAWLALPFLYVAAARLQGRGAAFLTAALGIALLPHFVSGRSDVWVGTATAIAFCCYVLAREPGARRPGLLRFLCGFCALSAVDGHPYGVFFALMFVLLHTPELLRRQRAGFSFLAGCACYTLFWLGYHLALPGVRVAELPALFQATWSMESGIGRAQAGTGLNAANLIKVLQQFLYFHPVAAMLALPALVAALLRGRAGDRALLLVMGGSFLLVMLTLAHINPYYPIFWLPLLCLPVGSWLARLLRPAGGHAGNGGFRLSGGALLLLLATLILSTLQLEESAVLNRENNEGARRATAVGQELDRLLPAEDLVVAGTYEVHLGMLGRLNYGGSCSFTRDDPKYWPLGEPEAIVYTPGRDTGCHLLADWLREHDFRPAHCLELPHLGVGVAILYLSPGLAGEAGAVGCTPEDLAWMERA